MKAAEARQRLEQAVVDMDELLTMYTETPYTRTDGQWIDEIAGQARTLANAAGNYLAAGQVPMAGRVTLPAVRGITGNSGP
jgi:hypothetical protein